MLRLLIVWTATVLAILVVAAFTKAGPVLVTVAPGNGIHLSDVVFAFVAGGAAWVYTRQGRKG